MGCLGVVLVAFLALGPTRGVEDDPGDRPSRTPREEFEAIVKKHGASKPGEQYRALCSEYDQARAGYQRAVPEAKSAPRARKMARYFGEPVAERIRKYPQTIAKEAERCFERVRETAGDGAYPGGRLAEAAEQALHEMRDLAVGKPAPEIAAADLDGRTMKLSDFRGRVVVVNFWATWCGPCMALLPHERELVRRLAGMPFVLLGVNGDEDRDRAGQAVRREGVTWRSWWDGGKEGPTANQWNVRGRPAIYVIDRQGIIRHKRNESPGAEPLEKAVSYELSLPNDPLLAEQWYLYPPGDHRGNPGSISAIEAWRHIRPARPMAKLFP